MRFILILSFISTIVVCNVCKSQVNFPISPKVYDKGDTTYQELTHPTFYSYFTHSIDSIFIDFNKPDFYQLAAINKKDGHGYFVIKHEKKVLIKYEIRERKISGVALRYHPNLLNKKYPHPYCQALFKEGKLHGVILFFGEDQIVNEILLFKKGKYKKHLYHYKAITNQALKEGNKKATNPFENKDIVW